MRKITILLLLIIISGCFSYNKPEITLHSLNDDGVRRLIKHTLEPEEKFYISYDHHAPLNTTEINFWFSECDIDGNVTGAFYKLTLPVDPRWTATTTTDSRSITGYILETGKWDFLFPRSGYCKITAVVNDVPQVDRIIMP